MALYLLFILVLSTCWTCIYSNSGLLEPARRPPCNQTLTTLQQLQEVSLNPATQSTDYVLCVNLMQSATSQQISYSAAEILYASVIISGNSSVVRCEAPLNTEQLPLNDYTQFPLIFANSSFVIIEGVQFEGCMRPLRFNWVTRVELTSSNFRDFYPGGAVEISNCPQVIISGCRFTNNTSLGIGVERYSGNAGAVSVGYNDLPRPEYLQSEPPMIVILESIFENNNATAAEAFQYDVSEVLNRRLYNQRGGSIACYFGTRNYSATVNITRSMIRDSFARDAGGGVYMFLAGDDNAHTVNIWKTNFINNEALDGGGLEITQSTPDSLMRPSQVTVSACNFIENVGNFGGGFKSIQLDTHGNMNSVTVRNTSFFENRALVGSGLYLQSLYAIDTVRLEKRIIVEDCTFTDNVANRGALFIIRNTVGIQGKTIFERNTGPGLRVVGGLAALSGNILFSENRHNPEGFSGALHLSSFGQIELQRGTNITFANNSGIEGAAIVVIGQLISAGFTEQLYNPQCFLQYEDPRVPPPSWEVRLVFRGNRAAIGPVIYASDVDVCEWYDTRSPFFEDIQESWTFMEMSNNYLLRGTSELDLPDYYIQTVAHSIWLPEDKGISAAPGDNIAVNVVALDEFRHNTTAFLELSAVQEMKNSDQVVFSPSIVQTVAGVGQIQFTYLSSTLTGNTTVRLTPTFITEKETSGDLTLMHDACLPGYFLMDRECICEETGTVALCDPRRRGILLTDGLWGAPPNWSRELVAHVCPPGYCNCTRGFDDTIEEAGCLLEYDDPYAICHNTRTGLLCGECKEGYGVGLLSNQCKKFTDIVPQFWLFPIYLGVLVPLLVVIVKLGVHLPTILRGFIFYIQISPIAVEFLPQSFNLAVDVMSCIASTLALYVPYDFSFHEGMTSLESYGLRYVTPLVALIVVPIAARVRRPHTKYWHGVWTIIQIMYIMAVETSVSLLLCPTLSSSSGNSKLTIWFYDGSVQCYRGWHILLAIMALLSLLALGLIIPLIAATLYFKYFRRKLRLSLIAKLEPFSFALAKGLKEKYRWWPIMDMACRYLFIVVIVSATGKKIIPLLLSLMLFIIQFYIHPYEDTKANYLESFVLFSLVVFLGLGSTTSLVRTSHFHSNNNFTLWPLFYLPVAVGAVVATGYIVYQIWRWLWEHNKLEFLEKKAKHSKRAQTLLRRFTVSKRSVVVRQESITQSEVSIFDDHTEQKGHHFRN